MTRVAGRVMDEVTDKVTDRFTNGVRVTPKIRKTSITGMLQKNDEDFQRSVKDLRTYRDQLRT